MWVERAASKIDRDYDKALRKMSEIKSSMNEAQRVYDTKQEGHVEGIAQVARKMKNAGQLFSAIMEFTGLPKETVEQL